MIRRLIKDQPVDPPCDRSELLLFLAARAQLVRNVIRPALVAGKWVVSDRFSDSTLAYQGYGRGLSLAFIASANDFACEGLRPDLTLILDVEPATAAARLRGREAATHTTADRIERAGDGFHARMRAECRAPEVKTVFSAWGSYGWLDQHRRFGTRGVISERAAYADFLMSIWSALEAGDAARADDLFAKYLLMMNLSETIPGGHLRGFNLYVLKRRGIFRNLVSRDYVTPGDTSGKWKLETRVFTPDEIAAIEDRLSRLAL